MALTEEELVRIKKMVLTAARKEMVRNVDPQRHFTFLRAKLVLDERDCEEISAAKSRIASAELFVDILLRKGPNGYDHFCGALMYEKTQLFLLEHLNRTFEILKSKVKTHKAMNTAQQNQHKKQQQQQHQHQQQQHRQQQQQHQQQHPRMSHTFPSTFKHQSPLPYLGLPDRPGCPPGVEHPTCNPSKPMRKIQSRESEDDDTYPLSPQYSPQVSNPYPSHAQSPPQMMPQYSYPPTMFPHPHHSMNQFPDHFSHSQTPHLQHPHINNFHSPHFTETTYPRPTNIPDIPYATRDPGSVISGDQLQSPMFSFSGLPTPQDDNDDEPCGQGVHQLS